MGRQQEGLCREKTSGCGCWRSEYEADHFQLDGMHSLTPDENGSRENLFM
jgi:hypothetical protein